jgi:hypothetical protein
MSGEPSNPSAVEPAPTPAPAQPQFYTPGFAMPKLILACAGLALMALSFDKLGPLLRLGISGGSAMAETVRVVQRGADGTETDLVAPADLADVEKHLTESRERAISLWPVYRFTTDDGRSVEARSPIGVTLSLSKLHPYRDADGLPQTLRVWYDRNDPSRIAVPFQFLPGTWYPSGFGSFFVPSMIFSLGLAATLVGLLLWWRSKTPIQVPDLSRAHLEDETKRLPAAKH